MDIGIREVKANISKYLKDLPFNIVDGKSKDVLAVVSKPGISEDKKQLELYKAENEELGKRIKELESKSPGVPIVSIVESPVDKKDLFKQLKAQMEVKTNIEPAKEYHRCQWKFGCFKDAEGEAEDAEFDGVKYIRVKRFYCKTHSAKAKQNVDKLESDGMFI